MEREIQYTGGEYQQERFRYRLLRPAQVESGKTYPLILFLHGAGERGSDNKNQLKYLPEIMGAEAQRAAYPCFVLAPQCRAGKQWVNVPWSDKQSTPMAEQPSHQLQVALEMLNQTQQQEPVDPKRIYLTGLSMGGYGAWELAARYPERFAALVPICGGADELHAPRLKSLPTWVFHGSADAVVPVVRSQTMVAALRQVGNDVRYTEYQGVGHNSWNRAYGSPGLIKWMFEQRRP